MVSNPIKYAFDWVVERIHKPNYEPEYEEVVEHDMVLSLYNGQLVEVTGDDSEAGE